MRKDNKPYFLKKCIDVFTQKYIDIKLRPQFYGLGQHPWMLAPWRLKLQGDDILAGDFLHVITDKHRPVKLTTWQFGDFKGAIKLGDYCLVCPGVRIDAATQVEIGDNCMIAAGAYLTDSDWHDIYDRTQVVGRSKAIRLADNVWIGDGATVCKGVTIGENSIVGTGAVVAQDVPANVIVAGNPARVVKPLDPEQTLIKRKSLFEDYAQLRKQTEQVARWSMANNSWFSWLRSLIMPAKDQ